MGVMVIIDVFFGKMWSIIFMIVVLIELDWLVWMIFSIVYECLIDRVNVFRCI